LILTIQILLNITSVCPGEQFTLECQNSLQDDFILEWGVYVPYHSKTYSKLYSKDGVRDPVEFEIELMVTLSFDRTSESGSLPLVSLLSINNVSMKLNETRINCTESSNDNNIIIQTVIHIINSDFGKLKIMVLLTKMSTILYMQSILVHYKYKEQLKSQTKIMPL
jgi:hypothetical protein